MARETIQPAGRLRETLRRIDGRGDCEGAYAFDGFTLLIDHAQADPFAAPSRVQVEADVAGFPARCLSTKTREVVFREFLARAFAAAVDTLERHLEVSEDADHLRSALRDPGIVADPATVKVRSEDGRRVEKVDISPFIAGLPDGRDTRAFSTETSQAANIMEALETGARVLLIDEDTAATNMMIRDRRMQEIVADEQEPITPFIDRVQALYRDLGVSTVLVIGGSGDYFDIADTVVCMQAYRPEDVTARAKAIAARHAPDRIASWKGDVGTFRRRVPDAGSIDASKGRQEAKVAADGVRGIRFGVHEIDLSAVAQVVDPPRPPPSPMPCSGRSA